MLGGHIEIYIGDMHIISINLIILTSKIDANNYVENNADDKQKCQMLIDNEVAWQVRHYKDSKTTKYRICIKTNTYKDKYI